jgi:hypothetical protein
MKAYFIAFFFISVLKFISLACDCKPATSIEKSLENSRLVVHVKILSKEFITYSETLLPQWADSLAKWSKDKGQLLDLSTITPNVIRIRVLVLKAYKNQTHLDTLTIFSPRNSSSCGINTFEIGKKFLLFDGNDLFKFSVFTTHLNENVQLNNTFWTHQCTRTVEANQPDLDSLDLITSPIRILNPKTKKCDYYLDSLSSERIYTNADILPQFKSGLIDLMDYYKSSLTFPPLINNLADTIFNTQVSFIINPNGRISRIQFVKSEIKSYEKDLILFIKKMPPWKPGKCGDNFISFEVVLNFRFESIHER